MSETLVERKKRERLEKIRAARKRQQIRLLISGGFIVLVLSLVFMLLNSSAFAIKEVEISKPEHVSQKEVEEAKKKLLGKNIFRAPVSDVREVFSQNPWVKEVSFKKRYPDRISVYIEERVPVGQIFFNSNYFLVSTDGMVLDSSQEPYEIIQISDLPLKNLKTGSVVKSAEFDEAMKVYKELPEDLKKKIFVISAASQDRLIFYIEGTEIIYGSAEFLAEKNQIIKEILSREGTRAISIDIRVPENPIVKTQP